MDKDIRLLLQVPRRDGRCGPVVTVGGDAAHESVAVRIGLNVSAVGLGATVGSADRDFGPVLQGRRDKVKGSGILGMIHLNRRRMGIEMPVHAESRRFKVGVGVWFTGLIVD